jgi:putative transposase
MKFVFIAKHRGVWPVAWLCNALGVSRSGFHAWLNRAPSARSRRDEVMSGRIKASFVGSDRTYGARRVWRDLLAEGVDCGLHKVERLMRLQALRARPRRRRLPKDDGDRQIAVLPSNLLDRQFAAERPNQKWIADFTYIWPAEGWLYVSAVIDLFSRRVVGWSMSAGMTAQLVADALVMAVWRPWQAGRTHASLRSRQPICQRPVPAPDGRQRHHMQHEPVWQRLGQCCHGELLLVAENRAYRSKDLPHQERGQG